MLQAQVPQNQGGPQNPSLSRFFERQGSHSTATVWFKLFLAASLSPYCTVLYCTVRYCAVQYRPYFYGDSLATSCRSRRRARQAGLFARAASCWLWPRRSTCLCAPCYIHTIDATTQGLRVILPGTVLGHTSVSPPLWSNDRCKYKASHWKELRMAARLFPYFSACFFIWSVGQQATASTALAHGLCPLVSAHKPA